MKQQTLSFLKQTGFNLDNLTIFVASEEQKRLYEADISGIKMVVSEVGVCKVRTAITKHYPLNERVLSMDDDIQGLWLLKDNQYEILPPSSFVEVVESMFSDLVTYNRNMFGVYPTKCKLFQEHSLAISTDVKFCIGHFFGVINKKVLTHIDYKEDYERSIEYALRDGGVLRYNKLCCITKFGIPGGVNKKASERVDTYNQEIKYLVDKYPLLVNINKKRKGEILLTTSRKKFLTQQAIRQAPQPESTSNPL